MRERVQELMVEILDVEKTDIDDSFGPDSTNNWDSLNNLRLITAIESEFNISLSMEEIQAMVDFKSILSFVESKTGE